MGLRCIIGHDYGEPERSEEREERGEEVVVTVREYKACRRCGHKQVMSENTEVRTTEPDATEADDTADTAEGSSPEPESGEETGEFEDVSASEDDGVILEDEDGDGETPERGHGEWPDAEGSDAADPDHEDWPDDHRESATGESEADHGDWPAAAAEDEGFDAEPSSGGPAEDVEFGGGLTPERSEDAADDPDDAVEPAGDTAEAGAGSAAVAGSEETPVGIRRETPGPTPTTQQGSADPGATLACPECRYTTPAHESSLRPGDICPECSRGYLAEHEDDA